VRVRTVATYHDDKQGAERGKNAIFIFDLGGLRIAHLGDLGHKLSDDQVKQIGAVDVATIPVGGFYTLDGKGAAEVIGQLKPKIAIPMHYTTPVPRRVHCRAPDRCGTVRRGVWRVRQSDADRANDHDLVAQAADGVDGDGDGLQISQLVNWSTSRAVARKKNRDEVPPRRDFCHIWQSRTKAMYCPSGDQTGSLPGTISSSVSFVAGSKTATPL